MRESGACVRGRARLASVAMNGRGLSGKRVLVLRPRHQAEATAKLLRERGAEPLIIPLLEIAAPPDPEPLARALASLDRYDLVAFTSANAVHAVVAALAAQGKDASALACVSIASIGPGTSSALEEYGLVPRVVAKKHVGEGMVEPILEALAESPTKRVLFPRALVAREELPALLAEAGVKVDVVPAYETRPLGRDQAEALRKTLAEGAVDAVLVTSSSTLSSLKEALGDAMAELLSYTVVATIGPIAERTAAAMGVRVDVSADPSTMPSLLDALERHFAEG